MNPISLGKALLVPVNSKGEILIQDRRGYKKPDWGFFGGGIESGETPLEAVIRETKEELDIDIGESELIFLGEISLDWAGDSIPRYFFYYHTNKKQFTVFEGKAALWMSYEEARNTLDKKERFDELIEKINGLGKIGNV